MKNYLVISRAPFLSAIIIPAIFATAFAYYQTSSFNFIYFVLYLLGLAAAHAGSNIINDYFDYKLGADQHNENRNQFSGGSPHMVNGSTDPKVFRNYAISSFLVALLTGTILVLLIDKGPGPILYFAIVGFLLGLFYTAPPFKLAYRGLGEIAIFLCFGVLPVLAIYYIQTRTITFEAFMVSIPFSLLVTNIIWINQFPDYESDRIAGKNHLVTRLGLKNSRYVYYLMSFFSLISIVFYCALGIFTKWSLLTLLAAPLLLISSIILHRNFQKPKALVPAQGLTIMATILCGIILTISLFFQD